MARLPELVSRLVQSQPASPLARGTLAEFVAYQLAIRNVAAGESPERGRSPLSGRGRGGCAPELSYNVCGWALRIVPVTE